MKSLKVSEKLIRVFFFLLSTLCLNLPAFAYDFAGGTGQPNDPYQIETAEQLLSIGSDPNLLDKCYILINDIDLDPNVTGIPPFTQALIAPDTNSSSSGFQGTKFTGIFDGNNHTIFSLFIDDRGASNNYLGMFGVLGQGCNVEKLKIVDINITCSNSHTGGLAGDNYGNIIHCFIINAVINGVGYVSDYFGGLVGVNSGFINHCNVACSLSGDSDIGGLVGSNYNGTILNCSATGIVTGRGSVGGLVGSNYDDDTISNCSVTLLITGINYPNIIGGLVGYNRGNISNSYATGFVTGGESSDYFGGLVGYNDWNGTIRYCYATNNIIGGDNSTFLGGLAGYVAYGNIDDSYATGSIIGGNNSYNIGGLVGANSASIINSYACGIVTGSNSIGGFSGYDYGGFYSTCFWDSDINPDVNGVGNVIDPNVIGLPTSQMQAASTFINAGWDFNDVWAICEGINYPKLQWAIPPADLLCPDGVDFLDYAYFSDYWLNVNCADSNDCEGADFNLSGSVDANDLNIFTSQWLKE